MQFAAVVVAGGAGLRAGGGTPKQWRLLAGKPLARWSLEAFLACGARPLALVAPASEIAVAQSLCRGLDEVLIVEGGRERMDSVRSGLEAIEKTGARFEAVLIHDAARPFLKASHVESLLTALSKADGALPGLAVSDTLKRANPEGFVSGTADRSGLFRAQTPQAFRWPSLKEAFAAWPPDLIPTDDAQVVERHGGRVVLIHGDPALMKATYPEDFAMLESLAGAARVTRTGMGFDTHRFGPGEGVWLCGVLIPFQKSLIGHSDADAGLHALTDAILGAIGEGDIGDHFPPTDPQWKGASSDLFLRHAVKLVAERGGSIVNVDVTLICERPKIKPYRHAMRARLADLLGLSLDRVSVKATTTEGLGFTGREEGLAAQALATVETPG